VSDGTTVTDLLRAGYSVERAERDATHVLVPRAEHAALMAAAQENASLAALLLAARAENATLARRCERLEKEARR
jgi:hypothetical protein